MNVKKITITGLSNLALVGCVSTTLPPQSYSSQIIIPILSENERSTVVNTALMSCIKNQPKFKSYNTNLDKWESPTVENGVLGVGGLNATFKHKFTLSAEGRVLRTDVSTEHHGNDTGLDAYSTLTDDYGFKSYVETCQNSLSEKITRLAKEFSSFDLSNYKVSVIDQTSLLSKDKIRQVEKSLNKQLIASKEKLFENISNYGSFDQYVTKKAMRNFRDEFSYEVQDVKKGTLKIKSIQSTLLPHKFSILDESLGIEMEYVTSKRNLENSYSSHRQAYLVTFTNKTQSVLTLTKLNGYRGNDIVKLGRQGRKQFIESLAPESSLTIMVNDYKFIDHPRGISKNINTSDQAINFGLSVNYSLNDSQEKTLYKKEAININYNG